jgi:hypothetical protein
LVSAPANFTLDLLTVFSLLVLIYHSTVNFDCLFFSKIILLFVSTAMPLLYRRVFRLSPVCDGSLILSTEILNCKFQSAQLDGVSSAEFVVLDVFIG